MFKVMLVIVFKVTLVFNDRVCSKSGERLKSDQSLKLAGRSKTCL